MSGPIRSFSSLEFPSGGKTWEPKPSGTGKLARITALVIAIIGSEETPSHLSRRREHVQERYTPREDVYVLYIMSTQ